MMITLSSHSFSCISTTTSNTSSSSLSSDHRHSQLISLIHRRKPISQTLRNAPPSHRPKAISFFNKLFYLHSFHNANYSFRISSQIPAPKSHWNTLTRACADSSAGKYDALLLFSEMHRQQRVVPDKRTYFFALKPRACSLSNILAGKQIHSQILIFGFGFDISVHCDLISCYASCGLLESACKVFDEMSVRSSISWNLFIDDLVRLGEFEFALRTFLEMLGLYESDEYTVERIASSCVGLGVSSLGMCVLGFLLKMCDPAVWTDVLLNNLIVQIYCKCLMLTLAKQVFDRMHERDVKSWNSLILGFAMQGEVNMALDYFDGMVKKNGFQPNSITSKGVSSSCKHKGVVDEGKESILLEQKEEARCGESNDKGSEERKCLEFESKHMSKETHGNLTAKQDTYAPLVTALKSAAEDNAASFHFPGHNRGQAAPCSLTELIGKKPYAYDLPELPELDNLFAPEGPILDAQKRAAEIFGASETWFLTGGTTCGVQASIMATCSPGDVLILPRNCHISAISGMVLSGVTPKYIIPDYNSDWDIASPVTPSQVNEAIKDLESEGRKPAAVLVTSPTYYGVCSNLSEISKLCRSKDIPLIVDEAHGAHFGFHPQLPFSALRQGADVAVQSTHKVLCSLTQSSMLHSSGKLIDRDRISRCLQTLQSTSPSYLLLASLDAATAQLATNSETVFKNAIHLANEAKSQLRRIPGLLVLEFPMVDPLRLSVGVWELGLSGFEADEFLVKDQGVMCELVGSRSITFVFTPGTREDHVQRLILGFKNLSKSFLSGRLDQSTKRITQTEPLGCSKMQLNPREAFFAKKRKVSIKESIGKICGELVCPYPPGIPVLIPGEVVTDKALNFVTEIKRQGGVITGASDSQLSSIAICDL